MTGDLTHASDANDDELDAASCAMVVADAFFRLAFGLVASLPQAWM